MTRFSAKVQKPYFCPFLGPFCPKTREREFSQIWDLRRKLANHNTLHFRTFLAKSNDPILRKSSKTLFLGLLGPFFPIFQKMGVFPKNRALSLLSLYGPLTSCKISKKNYRVNSKESALQTDTQTEEQTHGPEFIGPIRLKTGGRTRTFPGLPGQSEHPALVEIFW